MNCKKCGNVLNPTDVICPSCGEPVNPPAPMTSPVQEVVTNAPIAAPMASSDVAVNPSVMMQPEAAAVPAQAPISPVQEVVTNGPVATPMASTDVAVNPNVMVAPTEAQPVAAPAPQAAPTPATVQPTQMPAQDSNVAAQPAVDPMAQAGEQTPIAPVQQVPNAPQARGVVPGEEKKKLDIKFIVIVSVLVILIISLGVFVGTKLFGADKKPSANTTNTAGGAEVDNTAPDDGKEKEPENTTTSPVAASDEFTSYGYTFTIPSELKFTQENDLLSFSDGDNFLVNFTVFPASYDELKSDAAVKDLVKELDVKEIDHTETRLNGVKYTLVSYEVDKSYGIIFYCGLDDYHMAFGMAFGKESKSYDTAFEYISMIIKTAKTTSTFSPDNDKDKDYKIDKGMLDSGTIKSKEYKM